MFVAIAVACALVVCAVVKVVLMVPVWWIELHREDREAETARVAAAVDPAAGILRGANEEQREQYRQAVAKAGDYAKSYEEWMGSALATGDELDAQIAEGIEAATPEVIAAADSAAGWARVASEQ